MIAGAQHFRVSLAAQRLHTAFHHHACAAAILRRLRQALHDASPALAAGWAGWQPGDAAHPCLWAHVTCEDEHVTSIVLPFAEPDTSAAQQGPGQAGMAGGDGNGTAAAALESSGAGVLVPELALLLRLAVLSISFDQAPLSGVPDAWCQPGAFPQLAE